MIENIPNEFSTDITVLQKVTLTWHPYPKEKPTEPTDDESTEYLVTVLRSDGTRQACSADYSDGSFWWGDSKHTGVIAWMELPKPYEG